MSEKDDAEKQREEEEKQRIEELKEEIARKAIEEAERDGLVVLDCNVDDNGNCSLTTGDPNDPNMITAEKGSDLYNELVTDEDDD